MSQVQNETYLNSLEKYIIQNKAIRTHMKNTSKSLM